MYVVNEGPAMEARRRELVSEVRALEIRCRLAGERGLSTSLTRLGHELEAMSHAELRRRTGRVLRALDLVRAMLPSAAPVRSVRHLAQRAARRGC